MLNETQVEMLVSKFWEGIENLSWEDWCELSSSEKEEIVVDVLADLNDMTLDTDEVYEVFEDWSSGLEESSFVDFN